MRNDLKLHKKQRLELKLHRNFFSKYESTYEWKLYKKSFFNNN